MQPYGAFLVAAASALAPLAASPNTCVDVPTSGVSMQWSGDNHNHWHVVGLQEYRLIRLDNGVLVGTGAKTGFCFFDNTGYDLGLPGAPVSAVYSGRGASSSLSATVGL